MIKEYRAGDFTSGKMGEIFKQCYLRDMAVINHKQFGKAYLMPEEIVRTCVLNILLKQKGFIGYIKGIVDKNSGEQEFLQQHEKFQLHAIEDYFEDEFQNWFSVLTAL
jgi:hypothetical protein|tara:strand:- start:340 stop:663 length:324 start_codon:yes stop_codon:yes gene_type:complete